jgi:large subunit ribosomal protein L19
MLQQVNFQPGDTIRVHQMIREGEKSRIQIFKGVVLGIKGRGENKMFTVMKMVGDIAVERIFALNSPAIAKVDVAEHSKKRVKRAKLKHLRPKK